MVGVADQTSRSTSASSLSISRTAPAWSALTWMGHSFVSTENVSPRTSTAIPFTAGCMSLSSANPVLNFRFPRFILIASRMSVKTQSFGGVLMPIKARNSRVSKAIKRPGPFSITVGINFPLITIALTSTLKPEACWYIAHNLYIPRLLRSAMADQPAPHPPTHTKQVCCCRPAPWGQAGRLES